MSTVTVFAAALAGAALGHLLATIRLRPSREQITRNDADRRMRDLVSRY